MTITNTELLNKKKQNKQRTVVLTVNSQEFTKLFPNEKSDFDDYTEAYRKVTSLLGNARFNMRTKKMHLSMVNIPPYK